MIWVDETSISKIKVLHRERERTERARQGREEKGELTVFARSLDFCQRTKRESQHEKSWKGQVYIQPFL